MQGNLADFKICAGSLTEPAAAPRRQRVKTRGRAEEGGDYDIAAAKEKTGEIDAQPSA